MAAEPWVNETLYEGWGQGFRVIRELAHVKSQFQDIRLIETATHGCVLLLDGVVQITERDEFAYQEMITHVPMMMHGSARKVLIIGAGDGGVLRRVLQHRHVEKAVMVEIDGEVVRLAKEFMPSIAGEAWGDPRAQVIVGDGIAYVKQAPAESFDVIIVDSTDPVGVGEVLFTEAFYSNCHRVLTKNGIIVNQCGVPFMQSAELRDTSKLRAEIFPYVSAYVVAVPTYVGGFMTLGVAAKNIENMIIDPEKIKAAASRSGILEHTQYWTPEMQAAAFCLPPYIYRQLPTYK